MKLVETTMEAIAKLRLDNQVICPEDPLRILLPAKAIPHDATVSKRAGEVEFTLKHKLTMYGIPPEGSKIPAPRLSSMVCSSLVGKARSIR